MITNQLKLPAALLGVAVLTASGIYLLQSVQLNRLRAENQELNTQHELLKADARPSVPPAQTRAEPTEQTPQDKSELLRLRAELPKLSRELDAVRKQPASQPLSQRPQGSNSGVVRREQVAFIGCATPEASVQSFIWMILHNPLGDVLAAFPPPDSQAPNAGDTAMFEQLQKVFVGMQILAMKTLAKDRVELKVELELQAPLDNEQGRNPIFIVPMLKTGSDWKPNAAPRVYRKDWEDSDPRAGES